MSRRELTRGQRVFVALWRRVTMAMAGFSDPNALEFVRTFGVREFVRWVKTSFDLLQILQERWGPIEAQMIIACAGVWSGCRWCSIGHMLTGNLELFKREQRLGPVDEREIPRLQLMRDSEVLAELLGCYCGSRWEEMHALVHRQYLLRSGQVEESSRDDQLLQMTNYMWEWVNECTMLKMDLDPDAIPAQSAIGKDRALIGRYQQARRQARQHARR
ncbi:MAG: hypothetical protein AAGF11_56105 [Myxococcota bacterium]